jgi:L-seryl-tRNA(Ser) seleniumtransferase
MFRRWSMGPTDCRRLRIFGITAAGFALAGFQAAKSRGAPVGGILVGRKDLIEAGRLNTSPHSDSVCRISKVNKEEIVGMLVALEMYVNRDHPAVWREWEAQCDRIAGYVKGIAGVKTQTIAKKVYSAVPHLHISWDYAAAGKSRLTSSSSYAKAISIEVS